MVIFLFILLVLQSFLYLKADRAIFGTYITPTTALSLPYLLVLFTHILFHEALQFKPVSAKSILVWNIGTIIYWSGGVLLAKLALKKAVAHPFTKVKGLDIYVKGLYPLLLSLVAFLTLIMLYSLIKSLAYFGVQKIYTEEFATRFAGGGLFGYSLIILRFFLVYLLVITNKKNLVANIFIILIIGFNLIYQVKGWLLIPLLAAFLIRFVINDEKKGKISKTVLKRTALFFLVGASFFTFFYYLSLGSKMPIQFVFTHFFHYLWSGIIGLSEYLNSDLPIGDLTYQIFNPINNIYNKITGKEMDSVVNPFFFNTYNVYYKGSNVTTFFGSILVSAGYLKSVVIVFIFSFVNYGVLIKFLNNKTIINLVLYSFFLTALFFGWFNFYYQHLLFYIILVVGMFLNLLFRFSRKTFNQP